MLESEYTDTRFWKKPLYFVLNKSKKDFKELIDAKIIHGNPLSASNHLNLIGNNIDKWWYSDNIQKLDKFYHKIR